MIWTLYKAGVFLFPFLKELFLGKDLKPQPYNTKGPSKKGLLLKKFLIALAIVSFMSNVMFVRSTYDMAFRLLQANKEIARLKTLYSGRRLPELQKVTGPTAPDKPQVPVPPSHSELASKPVLPRRALVEDKKHSAYTERTLDEDVGQVMFERLKQIDKIQ